MRFAVVKTGYTPMFENPCAMAQKDEVLCGMVVELGEAADGWQEVTTEWGGHGYVIAEALNSDSAFAAEWRALGKLAARGPWVDVMEMPRTHGARLLGLPRGGRLRPLAEPDDDGFCEVMLPDGQRGFAKRGNLMPWLGGYDAGDEKPLREALAATALSYLGTQYRWGGRTPLGIDAPGLVSMAYLLNGARIPHGTQYEDTPALKRVDAGALKMGDLVYFEAHVAMFLGDDKYVHATAKNGSDGVVINSLDAHSPFFREDLARDKVLACASLFA